MNKKITIAILAFLGLTILAGCSKAIAPTPGDLPVDGTADNTDDINEEAEPDTIEVSSQREQVSGTDSSRSGFREGPVMVKSYIELDPRAFAGSENYDELRADCDTKIAQGVATQEECPTNTVLRLVRADSLGFPRQINQSEFNEIENDIEELTIGCVDEGNYYAAPIKNFRDDIAVIVSPDSQEMLMTKSDQDTFLNVRISKAAYDIPGRGGTACDIFFTKIEVLD